MLARNCGTLSYNSEDMPAYCAPCPGNIKPITGADLPASLEGIRAEPASISAAAAVFSATSAQRTPNPRRPVASVCATSPSGSSGCSRRCSANCVRWRASAAGVRAESTSNCGPAAGVASRTGADSSTTCTFVPPSPNELTPARRGSPPWGQSLSSVLTKKRLESRSMPGFGAWKVQRRRDLAVAAEPRARP